MKFLYYREIMLILNCRSLNVTQINFKLIKDNYKNKLGQLFLYTVLQIDVISQHLQQRPLCLTKQQQYQTFSMIDKTIQQQYQLFINDFYFHTIRCKRGLTSFDFCSKMDNCGCVHLKPNRSGTAWRRTRCLRKTERLASNGSQNSWVIYYFYYYNELSI